MNSIEATGIVAVPAEHPHLIAVLRAHALVERVKELRYRCLYLAALAGGFEWMSDRWRDAPNWVDSVATLLWPACLLLVVACGVLENLGRVRLERLLALDGAAAGGHQANPARQRHRRRG